VSVAGSQFYTDAINELLFSRTVMRGSYIFGFFRPSQCPEIHKELFEHRQNELERHTELLSQLLGDEDPDLQKLCDNRSQLLNTTKLISSSYKALLDVAVNAIVEKPTIQLPKFNKTDLKREKKETRGKTTSKRNHRNFQESDFE
jgi:hypothetical protein